MNAQDLIKKLKLYPIASSAIVVTILLILTIYLRGMSKSALDERHDQALKTWEQMDENVFKNAVNLETHLENAKIISQDVKERLIRPSQLAQNYQYFYRLESATGVKILTLQQQPAAPPPAGRGEPDKTTPPPLFSKIGYTMNVTGNFNQMLDFLSGLEQGHHFYHLKDFAIRRSTDPGNREIAILMVFDLLGTP